MKKNLSKKNKGFTLVELMVVVGIIAVISALSIFNSSQLNSSVLLSNTIYEVSLIVRDAQVAGLGAKVISAEGTGFATTSNQGVYFDTTNPEQIIFFADLDNSNSYTGLDEQSQVYDIEKRAGKILSICQTTFDVSGNLICNYEKLNIIFKRPNPEAYFYPSGVTEPAGYIGNVGINMGFPDGECRSLTIYKTGAVQIDKSLCPAL